MKGWYPVLLLALVVAACGDSGTSPTSPTPQPAPQVPAQVSVSLANPSIWVAWTPRRFGLAYDVTIRESAGTAIHINFLRLEAKDPAHRERYERAEIGADAISGGNKVAGNSTWSRRCTWYMNLWMDGQYAFKMTVDYTDVYGNHGEAVFKNDTYQNQAVGDQIRALIQADKVSQLRSNGSPEARHPGWAGWAVPGQPWHLDVREAGFGPPLFLGPIGVQRGVDDKEG